MSSLSPVCLGRPTAACVHTHADTAGKAGAARAARRPGGVRATAASNGPQRGARRAHTPTRRPVAHVRTHTPHTHTHAAAAEAWQAGTTSASVPAPCVCVWRGSACEGTPLPPRLCHARPAHNWAWPPPPGRRGGGADPTESDGGRRRTLPPRPSGGRRPDCQPRRAGGRAHTRRAHTHTVSSSPFHTHNEVRVQHAKLDRLHAAHRRARVREPVQHGRGRHGWCVRRGRTAHTGRGGAPRAGRGRRAGRGKHARSDGEKRAAE